MWDECILLREGDMLDEDNVPKWAKFFIDFWIDVFAEKIGTEYADALNKLSNIDELDKINKQQEKKKEVKAKLNKAYNSLDRSTDKPRGIDSSDYPGFMAYSVSSKEREEHVRFKNDKNVKNFSCIFTYPKKKGKPLLLEFFPYDDSFSDADEKDYSLGLAGKVYEHFKCPRCGKTQCTVKIEPYTVTVNEGEKQITKKRVFLTAHCVSDKCKSLPDVSEQDIREYMRQTVTRAYPAPRPLQASDPVP